MYDIRGCSQLILRSSLGHSNRILITRSDTNTVPSSIPSPKPVGGSALSVLSRNLSVSSGEIWWMGMIDASDC
jgi:hypothetical protein